MAFKALMRYITLPYYSKTQPSSVMVNMRQPANSN